MIDYSKKYQRIDNAEFTAENLVRCAAGTVWYTTENNKSLWCYEGEFLANYKECNSNAQ